MSKCSNCSMELNGNYICPNCGKINSIVKKYPENKTNIFKEILSILFSYLFYRIIKFLITAVMIIGGILLILKTNYDILGIILIIIGILYFNYYFVFILIKNIIKENR